MADDSTSGGAIAIRGFVAQTLVAILDMTSQPFASLTLEPHEGGEKFDILRCDADGSRHAQQIKTTKNSFSRSDLEQWAGEMADQRKDERCTLMLIGNIPPALMQVHEHRGVAIRTANLQLEACCVQAAQMLAEFMVAEGLSQGDPFQRLRTVDGLLGLLLRGSVKAAAVTRAQFRALLKEWIQSIPEPDPADWPSTAPDFPWRIADHHGVKAGFAALVTKDAPFRVLLIHGASDRGKSLFTNRIVAHVPDKLAPCLCARLELKGGNIDRLLPDFARHLGLDGMDASAASPRECLSSILRSLIARKSPAILVFDCFEDAGGDVLSWIVETLLPEVLRQKWLRIVISGQRVPPAGGTSWEHLAHSIELPLPTEQDWFEYAVTIKPQLDAAEVAVLYKYAGNKPGLMAQLLTGH